MNLEQVMPLQTQLLQALVQQSQNQPGGASNKRREFMQGHPPVFSHAAVPLEADDWLRAVERQLNVVQCDDAQKVLYASGQLQGAAQTWWESYQAARPANAAPVTRQQFSRDFKARHIPDGVIEQKQEEFRNLRMGDMSVSEYHDRFSQLARYAPNEVKEDSDKQRLYLKGIYFDLRLQLKGNVYPDFQTLVTRAIVLDNERKEMDRKRKRKAQFSGSNSRNRSNSHSSFQQRFQGPVSQWNHNQNQKGS